MYSFGVNFCLVVWPVQAIQSRNDLGSEGRGGGGGGEEKKGKGEKEEGKDGEERMGRRLNLSFMSLEWIDPWMTRMLVSSTTLIC